MAPTDWDWRLEKTKARDPRASTPLSRNDITGRTLSTHITTSQRPSLLFLCKVLYTYCLKWVNQSSGPRTHRIQSPSHPTHSRSRVPGKKPEDPARTANEHTKHAVRFLILKVSIHDSSLIDGNQETNDHATNASSAVSAYPALTATASHQNTFSATWRSPLSLHEYRRSR